MYKTLIRPLKISDAEISYKWRNNPEIWKYTGNKPSKIITKEIEEDWIKQKLIENNSYRFAITVDDVYVGNIQITDLNNLTGQYHIFIGEKEYWGKGIAQNATFQILRFARNIAKLRSVYLSVNPENLSAIRLYENCGFKKYSDKIEMNFDLTQDIVPKLSVFFMTYNHEEFIEQSLNSVLMQKTNFDFEIVVGEDCSTDNTRTEILKISQQYPGKFKLLLHKKNIGAMNNQMTILESCNGKYIAMLEGDDYWTDPLKLQKQVDFLEANQDYGLVHTNYLRYIHENKYFEENPIKKIDSGYIFKELLKENQIATLTVLVRRDLAKDALNSGIQEKKFLMGDYPLWLEISTKSKIGYLKDITSVYRVLTESASNTSDLNKQIGFQKSVLEIKHYFALKYNSMDILHNQELIFYKNLLAKGFKYKRRDLSCEAFSFLKKSTDYKIRRKDKLLYAGTYNSFIRYLTSLLMVTKKQMRFLFESEHRSI